MHKAVSEPFPSIVNGVMTGTTQLFSSISNIIRRDSVGITLQWTGAAVGSFQILVSNDYKPSLAQAEGYNPPNNGTWIPVAVQNPLTGVYSTTIQTTLGSPIAVNLNQLGFAWIQVVYTNASSTGVLNTFITAKSLG